MVVAVGALSPRTIARPTDPGDRAFAPGVLNFTATELLIFATVIGLEYPLAAVASIGLRMRCFARCLL